MRSGTWCGESVLQVDGEGWSVQVSPIRGGKIVSLQHGGIEWVAQPVVPLPPPARPGSTFAEREMCGWDECAPSIDACEVDGAPVPDHGDLWTERWWLDGEWLRAVGPSLGYEIARRVVADGPAVRFEYRARATGSKPVPFLWAAHPQFGAPPGSVLEVATDATTALDVMARPAVPVALEPATCAIDTVAPGGCRKLYLEPGASASSVRLRRPEGASLTMTWDLDAAPYVGLWFDRGAYSHGDVVAIEPSTGFYDSVASAVGNGHVATLQPGADFTWWCQVSFCDQHLRDDARRSGPSGRPGGQSESPFSAGPDPGRMTSSN